MSSIEIVDEGAVRVLVLCRPGELNTITLALRDELASALDEADRDRSVRVVVLRAEGRAFSAGFALDAGVSAQQEEHAGDRRVWDSVADLEMISGFARVWAKLHEISKPTIAAVQGWCIAGGTDIAFNADLILASESARFGYPPARVWGTPEAPWTWVNRLGDQQAKRYLFTGDEISGPLAAELGLALECVPDDQLVEHTMELAERIAMVPLNQLQMMKMLCNQVTDSAYSPATSRLLGCLFDGVARHTQEGLDFVAKAVADGPMAAVHDRDRPFGDYATRSTR